MFENANIVEIVCVCHFHILPRLSQMILDHKFHGILDQGKGQLIVYESAMEDVRERTPADMFFYLSETRSADNVVVMRTYFTENLHVGSRSDRKRRQHRRQPVPTRRQAPRVDLLTNHAIDLSHGVRVRMRESANQARDKETTRVNISYRTLSRVCWPE